MKLIKVGEHEKMNQITAPIYLAAWSANYQQSIVQLNCEMRQCCCSFSLACGGLSRTLRSHISRPWDMTLYSTCKPGIFQPLHYNLPSFMESIVWSKTFQTCPNSCKRPSQILLMLLGHQQIGQSISGLKCGNSKETISHQCNFLCEAIFCKELQHRDVQLGCPTLIYWHSTPFWMFIITIIKYNNFVIVVSQY
jgi:hypothetical protein